MTAEPLDPHQRRVLGDAEHALRYARAALLDYEASGRSVPPRWLAQVEEIAAALRIKLAFEEP